MPIISNRMMGHRYGMFTVLSYSHTDKNYQKYVVAKCDCGCIKTVCWSALRFGSSTNCGCVRKKILSAQTIERLTTHGKSKIPEYRIWKSIKQRCENKNSSHYNDYGGRGITMCSRWRNNFDNFINDMGARPSRNHSIERIKNDKWYKPSNCKWATKKEQNSNRRSNIYISYNGEEMIMSEFSKRINKSVSAVGKYIQIHGAKNAVLFYSKKCV